MKKSNKTVSSAATLRKVLRYLKHYRLLFALSLFLALIVVGLTLYFPILTLNDQARGKGWRSHYHKHKG